MPTTARGLHFSLGYARLGFSYTTHHRRALHWTPFRVTAPPSWTPARSLLHARASFRGFVAFSCTFIFFPPHHCGSFAHAAVCNFHAVRAVPHLTHMHSLSRQDAHRGLPVPPSFACSAPPASFAHWDSGHLSAHWTRSRTAPRLRYMTHRRTPLCCLRFSALFLPGSFRLLHTHHALSAGILDTHHTRVYGFMDILVCIAFTALPSHITLHDVLPPVCTRLVLHTVLHTVRTRARTRSQT